MNRVEKHKIIIIFICFAIFFSLVMGKAFKVQLMDAKDLIARANSQFLRQAKVYPKRGNIYDRDGNTLALNVQTYSIFTIPKVASIDRQNYRKLTKIIPELSFVEIVNSVKKRNKFTWI